MEPLTPRDRARWVARKATARIMRQIERQFQRYITPPPDDKWGYTRIRSFAETERMKYDFFSQPKLWKMESAIKATVWWEFRLMKDHEDILEQRLNKGMK